ncbi:MAG: FUSC family protein [Pseudomonadota bacterium]
MSGPPRWPRAAAPLRDLLAREVKGRELLHALAVIGPLVVAYLVSGETALLSLGLIAISLFVPARKLRLGPGMVALHFLVILAVFSLLFMALPFKPVFVPLTALAAFLAVAVTHYGNGLRSLGNWVFIPAVYLACEVRDGASMDAAWRHAALIVALSPVALALVCAGQVLDRRRPAGAPPDYGPADANWLLPAGAVALAVLAAAALVEALDIAQGQWLIWSSASVIVGDLSATTGKLKQRAMGALVGAPLGLLVGFAMPASRLGYSLAVLGAILTLIAFSRYVVGFGSRCFLIALAAAFGGGANGIAEERVANVLMGGAFGLAAVALMEAVWRRRAGKA